MQDRIRIHDVDLEILRRGSGAPVLLLHGLQNVDPRARFLDLLGERNEIIAPSHPGFGNSSRPDGFETVYDLVHLYLSLLDVLDLRNVSLMGVSFGGWVAAEIAALCDRRVERLVLVDAFGIKVSGRETADIVDVFNSNPADVLRKSWHDPARWAPDLDAMTDEELTSRARNWDALALYGWQPYMHNPRLRRWLARIKVPSLVLWGASDGIVTPAYGRAYSGAIPGAQFTMIDEAGHHPEIEQPERFVDHVRNFLSAKS